MFKKLWFFCNLRKQFSMTFMTIMTLIRTEEKRELIFRFPFMHIEKYFLQYQFLVLVQQREQKPKIFKLVCICLTKCKQIVTSRRRGLKLKNNQKLKTSILVIYKYFHMILWFINQKYNISIHIFIELPGLFL